MKIHGLDKSNPYERFFKDYSRVNLLLSPIKDFHPHPVSQSDIKDYPIKR